MKHLFIILLLCVLSFSCKDKTDQSLVAEQSQQSDSLNIKKEDINKINYVDIGLDAKTNSIMPTWQAYQTLSDAVQSLKQADYSFFNTDIEVFSTAIKDLEQTIPPSIKTQSIEARVLAFKTKLLNLKDLNTLDFIDKKDILFATKEVFVAFSNLNLQINKKLEKDSQNIERPY